MSAALDTVMTHVASLARPEQLTAPRLELSVDDAGIYTAQIMDDRLKAPLAARSASTEGALVGLVEEIDRQIEGKRRRRRRR